MKTTYQIDKNCGVDIELKESKNGLIFSASGFIWDSQHRYYISCGQNLEELLRLFPTDKKLLEIGDVWCEYHLNALQAGTQKQTDFLRLHKNKLIGDYYNLACLLLKENNLLFDRGYKFGASWLYKEIPAEIVARIKAWF